MNERSFKNLLVAGCLSFLTCLTVTHNQVVQAQEPARKIVLIAGTLDAGHGRGTHEYQKTVRLFAQELQPLGQRLNFSVESHFNGWPADPNTLDDADTIVLVSDGSDRNSEAHPFLVGDRLAVIQRQMDRGCGLVTIHWSTFWPEEHREKILRWTGGYFDYQTGPPPRNWFSRIKTFQSDCIVASPDHPIANGVSRFPLREEYYYRLQFALPEFGNVVPLLQTRVEEYEEPQTIGWAMERSDGGRGLGFTGGHFFDNWNQPDLRKLILNGILWTAHIGVPPRGVISQTRPKPRGQIDLLDAERINVLLITGNQHPAHDWRTTSSVLIDGLSLDLRVAVDQREIDFLEDPSIQDYDTIVLNYCNWKQPGLSDVAKENFLRFLNRGGGLNLIHFANGAFHRSLPEAAESDWPEYRNICRRVWDHDGNSGHDAYGTFPVKITAPEHPVTSGVDDFETIDELYFRQTGEKPIEVLATARSSITGQDEPMAFVYQYGKARVFQTVLGHAAESLRAPGTSRLIRNAVAWTAGRKVMQEGNVATGIIKRGEGNFSLNAQAGFVRVQPSDRTSTLMGRRIGCEAKLLDANGFNILVAQHPKSSALHWEIYTYQQSGELSLYLPGFEPAEIKSGVNVCDGQWHRLEAGFDGNVVRLYVDDQMVKRQKVQSINQADQTPGPLTIGALASQQVGCKGWIDDVTLSNLDNDTADLGHWSFDEGSVDTLQDRSPLKQDTEFIQTGIALDYLEKWTPKSRQNSRFPYENETDDDWIDNRFSRMNTGPTFSYSIQVPGRGMIPKAIAFRGEPENDDFWLFNTEQFRIEAGWRGEFLALPPARFGILKMPSVSGTIDYVCDQAAGWEWTDNGATKRADTSNSSLRSHDGKMNLVYDLGGHRVEESIELKNLGEVWSFHRKIVRPEEDADYELRLVLGKPKHAWVAFNGDRDPIDVTENSIVLKPGTTRLDFVYADVAETNRNQVVAALREIPAGSGQVPTRELKSIVTRGVLGDDNGPFAVDTITMPYENPDEALMFASGFDFLADGRAVLCTVHGDVWIVEGIDEDLDEIRWTRFATGLYQPLGLKVVQDEAFVMCRDRILKFEIPQLGQPLSAPSYHTFNDDLVINGQGHAYAMSLETDPQGNFYFIKSGGKPPHGGTMLKVAADGGSLEVFATGYRHCNGLGISPTGVITSSDNEGNWIPSTRIDVVQRGGFYGHMPTHRRQVAPATYDPPMIWLPRELDNSAGGQVWVDSESWGPLNGTMLHLSYGRCTANVVMPQQLESGQWQAAAYRLGLPPFLSGSMRGRFNPKDGHLYVVGLDGWQTAAVRDGCFQRVRATGKPFYHPVGFRVIDNQIQIKFPQPLDRRSLQTTAWTVEQWNYRYSEAYGSDHYRVSNPDDVGHDDMPVETVQLSDDGRTVTLQFAKLQSVMQMNIKADVVAVDGTPISVDLFNTIYAEDR